ncbi:MAG: S-layer homology domain-containing protein, partial [Clostridia bacterium]|nr:S-layer homology domain-containing protein [Clostridia bacterium]
DEAWGAAALNAINTDTVCYARYTELFTHPFTDLDMDDYYGEAVRYCLREGVMRGDGEASFSPHRTVSRAMLVTVLYRMEGEPDVSGVQPPFTDVERGAWYADSVAWAYGTGVVNGMTPTAFFPSDGLTREQFATVLYRYARDVKGVDVGTAEGADLSGYADGERVSAYAYEAVLWANVSGYVGGVSATLLSPRGVATRAQMATVLHRFATCQ